jgi:quercetin dioxygenase-like cupin family protein
MTPQAQLLDIDSAGREIIARWDITGHQVNRHLLSQDLTGTNIVLDHLTFPPGFVHHMHRHPDVDMVVIPLHGTLQFSDLPNQFVDAAPGQVLFIPRGAWHQISNATNTPVFVLHLFLDVGRTSDVGYEAHPATLALNGRDRNGDAG